MYDKEKSSIFVEKLIRGLEDSSINLNLEDMIINSENKFKDTENNLMIGELEKYYSEINPTIKLKAETILEFQKDEEKYKYEKIFSICTYDLFIKNKAREYLRENMKFANPTEDSMEVEETDDINEKSTSNIYEFLCNEYNIDNDEIHEINSLGEYIDIIKELQNDFVSRGHSNYRYKFLPSGHRCKNGIYYTNIEVRSMLSEFKRKITHYHPELNTKTSWELAAFAQHYGVPTYMLDFTESHLVSLLFALENLDEENDGLIIFIDFKKLNERFHNIDEVVDCSDYDYKYINGLLTKEILDDIDKPIFIKSDSINDRIHFQRGVFLLFPKRIKLTINGNYALLSEIGEFISLIIIPKEIKFDIIKELFNIGMTFESIYPDLDNAVRSIKFKISIDGREG